jgi:hypothetical protein
MAKTEKKEKKDKAEIIPIIQHKKGEVLSKLQKQFNANVKKIQDLKDDLERVETQIREVQVRVQGELIPLEEKVAEVRTDYVLLLDSIYDDKFFRKKEKEKIAYLINEEVYDLIKTFDKTELLPIHDKYAEETFEEVDKDATDLEKNMAKSMLRDMFGIDVDFEQYGDLNDPESMARMMAELEEKMTQKQLEEKEKQQTRQQNKKKTTKQIEAEKKREEESKNLNKTARSIYTELVKELHPDKEADEQEKIWKTEVMKRVTEAYEKDDLYNLLKLQIEYLNHDLSNQEHVTEDKLNYYNKILKEQIKELEAQLYGMRTMPSPNDFIQRLNATGTKGQVDYQFRKAKKDLNDRMVIYKNTMRVLKNNKEAREYLKTVEVEDEFFPQFDFPFELFDGRK